ncbi:MAG: hypothetical protein GW778_01240 [Alphaproteobacteria bacterium]|nr:hypothetical protein [Alphaproteobacteria bacterium]
MPQNNQQSESGNVFVFILLGVVLFAALSLTVARGFRSTTTSSMSDRKADLAASEILDYAQRMERTVDKLRRKGCSENDISFEYEGTNAYTFATQEKCKVFSPDGGNLEPWKVRDELGGTKVYSSFRPFRINGSWKTRNAGTQNAELFLIIGMINKKVCESINNKLGIKRPDGELPKKGGSHIHPVFTGSFSYPSPSHYSWEHDETVLEGASSGCVNYEDRDPSNGLQLFYHALIIR